MNKVSKVSKGSTSSFSRTLMAVSLSGSTDSEMTGYDTSNTLSLHSDDFDNCKRRDSLIVFQAAPLIWIDFNHKRHPLLAPDFEAEKNDLREAVAEAKKLEYGEIDLVFEEATTKGIGTFLATGHGPVLHFSCHGHPEYLCIENRGALQQLLVDELQEFIAAGHGQLKLVFVSACHSRPAGEAFIAAGVKHVVCCKTDVSLRDSAATIFAQTFYTSLSCGNHLKASFKIARQAVLHSPTVENSRAEMEKFLLLPEKPEDDPYHDLPIFYTSPTPAHRRPRTRERNIPPPPELLVGRELFMYLMLDTLAKSRCVFVNGPSGIGKSSVTKKVLNYVFDRSRTFPFEKHVWMPAAYYSQDSLSEEFCRLFDFLESNAILQGKCAESNGFRRCCGKIVRLLYDTRALIVIDARGLDARVGFKKLGVFLDHLLAETRTVVMIVCPAGRGFSFNAGCISANVSLDPLDVRSSVLLFGNICRYVQQPLYPSLSSAEDLADLLVPDIQENSVTSKRCKKILSRIGEGNPKKIREAAMEITQAKFTELVRLGIAQLEEDIFPRLSKQIQVCRNTADAQELQGTLKQLQTFHKKLPSIAELEQQDSELFSNFCKQDITPDAQSAGHESSSPGKYKRQFVGVDFYGAYMDEDEDWNTIIRKRKKHIEMQLKKLERFGTLDSGEPQMSIEQMQRNGMKRAVVRLSCEFDLREDLEAKDFELVKEICHSLAGFLEEAGASEKELKKLMVGTLWKGSICLLLEAPPRIFSLLFSKLSKTSKRIVLPHINPCERTKTLELLAIAPAFIITVPSSLLQDIHGYAMSFQKHSEKPYAIMLKEETLSLLIPTSDAALTQLIRGGIDIRSKDSAGWNGIPSIVSLTNEWTLSSGVNTSVANSDGCGRQDTLSKKASESQGPRAKREMQQRVPVSVGSMDLVPSSQRELTNEYKFQDRPEPRREMLLQLLSTSSNHQQHPPTRTEDNTGGRSHGLYPSIQGQPPRPQLPPQMHNESDNLDMILARSLNLSSRTSHHSLLSGSASYLQPPTNACTPLRLSEEELLTRRLLSRLQGSNREHLMNDSWRTAFVGNDPEMEALIRLRAGYEPSPSLPSTHFQSSGSGMFGQARSTEQLNNRGIETVTRMHHPGPGPLPSFSSLQNPLPHETRSPGGEIFGQTSASRLGTGYSGRNAATVDLTSHEEFPHNPLQLSFEVPESVSGQVADTMSLLCEATDMDEEPAKAREGMVRQSSFARSFFSSDSNPQVLEQQGEPSTFTAPPPARARRRSSARREIASRGGQTPATAAAAAASASARSDEEPTNLPHFERDPEERANRANSWYADALRQQGGTAENLTEILDESARSAGEESVGFDDDEVLEQYRFMAQHEARLRVKENTGFDMKEYEKRRKLQGVESKDQKSLNRGGRKARLKLPEPKKITTSGSDFVLRPMEPPPPPTFEHHRCIAQRVPRVPEVFPGEVYRGGSSLAPDEHLVKCLGNCGQQLRVKRLATLVSCPDCGTVSPATSARR